MYACLAVTCHLHFWQNDRDFLRATVVTRGWNGYRNKSQHRKSTLEKKILPPFQQGFEPTTFQSRVRRSNHWAIPAPPVYGVTQRTFVVRTKFDLGELPGWTQSLAPCILSPHSIMLNFVFWEWVHLLHTTNSLDIFIAVSYLIISLIPCHHFYSNLHQHIVK